MGVATSAQSTQNCNAILSHGINNVTTTLGKNHSKIWNYYQYCKTENISDDEAQAAGLTIFGKGKGFFNSSEARKAVTKWCEDKRDFAEKSSFLFDEARALNSGAVQAWENCVTINDRVDMSVTISDDNAQFVEIHVDSKEDGNLRLLPLTATNYDCEISMVDDSGKSINFKKANNPLIKNNNFSINCERKKPTHKKQDGVGSFIYDSARIVVKTTGPSLPLHFNEVVEEYTVTPPSSVIAFDNANCPPGWSSFENVYGRFIIGSGTLDGVTYEYGSKGGQHEVVLDKTQMPSHSHKYNRQQDHGGGCGLSGCGFHSEYPVFETKPNGGDENGNTLPHNNIPPYLALNYCVKN